MFTAATFTLAKFSEKFSSKLRNTNELFIPQALVEAELGCPDLKETWPSGTQHSLKLPNACSSAMASWAKLDFSMVKYEYFCSKYGFICSFYCYSYMLLFMICNWPVYWDIMHGRGFLELFSPSNWETVKGWDRNSISSWCSLYLGVSQVRKWNTSISSVAPSEVPQCAQGSSGIACESAGTTARKPKL